MNKNSKIKKLLRPTTHQSLEAAANLLLPLGQDSDQDHHGVERP